MEKRNKFSVIEGGKSPSELSKQYDSDVERILCRVCEQHEGVASGDFLPVHSSVYDDGNKRTAAIEKHVCLNCLLNGRKTYL